jgi:hypothetical protein
MGPARSAAPASDIGVLPVMHFFLGHTHVRCYLIEIFLRTQFVVKFVFVDLNKQHINI